METEVIMRHHIGGREYAEIAAEYQMPEAEVREVAYKGLMRLKERIFDDSNNPPPD